MCFCGRGGETSARTVNHLYSSIAISRTLWCWPGMFLWNEENTQTSKLQTWEKGREQTQLVFHHKLMQHRMSSDLLITLPLYWCSSKSRLSETLLWNIYDIRWYFMTSTASHQQCRANIPVHNPIPTLGIRICGLWDLWQFSLMQSWSCALNIFMLYLKMQFTNPFKQCKLCIFDWLWYFAWLVQLRLWWEQ